MSIGKYIFLSIIFGFAINAYAQTTYDGCTDFRGQPVISVLDYSIRDVAIARIEGGQAVIRYNPNVLSQMTEPTRQFFYVHECAHHALQHAIRAPSLQSERAADCWAINTMKDKMGLSNYRLNAIQRDIARQGRGDWTHLPGPHRAIDIENCLGQSTGNSVGARNRVSAGFPAGYGMKQCACWGFSQQTVAQEPRCRSGYVRVNQCAGYCPGGGSPYAYVCQ